MNKNKKDDKKGDKKDDKDEKKDDKKEDKKDVTKISFKKKYRIPLITLVHFGILSVFGVIIYKSFIAPPSLADFKLDQYWGQYPINPKPDLSIRNYTIEFSDVMVIDLEQRLIHRRRFVPPLENAGFTYGFNTIFLSKVLDYWQNKYNFKEREKFFNKYNHFITNVQGLDIHFMHVKPKVDPSVEVVPLLILHGWPGSIREFYEIIPKLTTPRPGYKFVFEVIAPSLPGYGFSQAAVRTGLGPNQIAVIMSNLMKRIGHERFYVQGGDWGHFVGAGMATLFPDQVLGFHTNMPLVMTPVASFCTMLGASWPRAVDKFHDRMYPLDEHIAFSIEESGYMHLQATKPDTIGIALTDSPAGLAAYILEKFSTFTKFSYKEAYDGRLDHYSLTHLLDNIMVYWSTNSITTAMRLYAEAFSLENLLFNMDMISTEVPTWGIKFKYELMYQPDYLLKMKYKNYLHSTVVESGGHFAAFENPDIMADDMFEAIDTFMEFHGKNGKSEEKPTETVEAPKTIYDFTVKDIKGKDVKLDKYKGHVVIIVNVASQCGLTDTNYKQLNELYEKYAMTKGLRILAFPCNQFGSQEPGSLQDILKFTKDRGVKFDLFEKIEVNGDNTHPLWKFLKSTQGGTIGDFIKWNFSKFIIDKNGVPVERLGPNVNPIDMEPYLAKYW